MNRVAIRVIGAPLILAALALIVYLDNHYQGTKAVTILIGVFAAASFHELCAMGRVKGLRPAEVLGLTGLAFSFGVILLDQSVDSIGVAMLVVLLGSLLNPVFRFHTFTPQDAGFTFLSYAYIALLLFIPFQVRPDVWMYWLLFLLATNKGSDMAAYVVGKTMGRHKLAPTVSPNKTWEGSIAGLVAGAALGFVVLEAWIAKLKSLDPQVMGMMGVYQGPSQISTLAMAVSVTVAAQLGDLVKSAVKRWAGVKDSGRLLPEFGGALDMVDSFILSAPVAWIFLHYGL
jgi:phosphatidate cytidylyltransferase